MTSSATLFATGMYVFASICIAAVLIMVALWLFYKLDEAVDDYRCRRERRKEMKKQEIK
jgi:NO-binding membrane sensor protein with MHYT domain